MPRPPEGVALPAVLHPVVQGCQVVEVADASVFAEGEEPAVQGLLALDLAIPGVDGRGGFDEAGVGGAVVAPGLNAGGGSYS